MDHTVHGILQARILKWVAFPFSRGFSQPRDRTQVSCIAGRFFTSRATREALMLPHGILILKLMWVGRWRFRFLGTWASLVAQLVKNPLAMWETWVRSLGWEDPLEKGKATHSSILAWRIPWTVWSMELQRVRHKWATFTSLQFLYSPTLTSLHDYWKNHSFD